MVTGQGSSLRYVDDTLSGEQLADYHLSIHLDPVSASFAIVDTTRNVVLSLLEMAAQEGQNLADTLNSLLEDPLLANPDFHAVSLGLGGIPATLCPASLAPAEAETLLTFSYGQPSGAATFQEIGALKGLMCYEVPDQVKASFLGRFPQGRIFSSDGLLIESLLRKSRTSHGAHLYLDYCGSYSSYYLTQGDKLLLYNWFKTESEFDLLYHGLNICNQHEIAEDEVQVNLSGKVEPGGAVFRLMKEHFKKVDINFGLDFHKMALGLSRVKRQQHLGLLNQYVCVS